MSKGLKTVLWVLSILLGAMFVFSGGMKLLKADEAKPMFVHYGYAAWFATFIGVCEALGGLGLLLAPGRAGGSGARDRHGRRSLHALDAPGVLAWAGSPGPDAPAHRRCLDAGEGSQRIADAVNS
jgi:DoxX-like family